MRYAPKEVAAFMIDEIHRRGEVSRTEMLELLSERFGPLDAIDTVVLARFRHLHSGTIRWIAPGERWRSLVPGRSVWDGPISGAPADDHPAG